CDLWRDHDHARPAEGAGGKLHRPQRRRPHHRAVLMHGDSVLIGYGARAASIPPPKRGRVGVRRSALVLANERGRELTPTRRPPTKSGVADLPLLGGGIAGSV